MTLKHRVIVFAILSIIGIAPTLSPSGNVYAQKSLTLSYYFMKQVADNQTDFKGSTITLNGTDEEIMNAYLDEAKESYQEANVSQKCSSDFCISK